jgi:microcystin-dependent protein
MAEPFIGQITLFAGNFAPRGWAFCQGQLLAIAQNTALFSILGTTYGGNGQTTFALPDLRGRTPVGPGQGPGLSNYSLGQSAGVESVTLSMNEMPQHTHALNANTADATQRAPGVDRVLAREATAQTAIYSTAAPNTAMSPQAIGAVGSSQPHTNLQPYLAVNYIIALEGIFPSRN